MLARIPSNEFQIRNEEVEIKFNADDEAYHHRSSLKNIISLLIVLVLTNFYYVSSFHQYLGWKLETKPPFIKRYLSPGLKSIFVLNRN